MSGLRAAISEGFRANILPYLPVISEPAVDDKNYRVQNLLVIGRGVSVVALGLFSTLGLAYLSSPKSPLPLRFFSLIVAATPGLLFYEWRRAGDKLDEVAVDHFRKEIIVSEKAKDHILSSPRAFSMLPKECLDRQNGSNKTLREEILSLDKNGQSVFSLLESRRALQAYLQSEKFAPPQDPREQAKIWKQVRNPFTIDLLCQRGFDINAKDEEGQTPLQYWASLPYRPSEVRKGLPMAAVNAGADLRVKASQLVPKNDYIGLKIFLQDAESMPPLRHGIELPKDETIFRWFPWKATAYKGDYQFEAHRRGEEMKWSRVAVLVNVAWLSISVLALCSLPFRYTYRFFPLWSTATKVLLAAAVASLFIDLVNIWRNSKQAKREAVIEYLTKPYPSKQAAYTISHDLEAAQMLIEFASKKDLPVDKILSKFTDDGETLLTQIGISFEIFKLLVDAGADPHKKLTDSYFNSNPVLFQAVRNQDPRFISHLFESKHLDHMTPELKIELWRLIHSENESVAQVLLANHIHPDEAKDDKGNTPLMRVVHVLVVQDACPSIANVQILLKAGADPMLKNKEGKTAIDLITIAAHRELFLQLCERFSSSYREKFPKENAS